MNIAGPKPGDYEVFELKGSDYQVTRTVCNKMAEIVNRALAPGFAYLSNVETIFYDCFRGFDFDSLTPRDKANIICDFVREKIRYEPDPEETEYVMYPHVIYREGYGDCDDMTVLSCTLGMMAGIPSVKIQAVKYKGDKYFSHVYPLFFGEIFDPCMDEGEAPVIVKGDKFITIRV